MPGTGLFKTEFMNIPPQREIKINITPGFIPGMVLFGTFLVNEAILIIKPDNKYNSIICGTVYMTGAIVAIIIYRSELKRFGYLDN